MIKTILCVLIILTLPIAVLPLHSNSNSSQINILFDLIFTETLQNDPEFATLLGLPDTFAFLIDNSLLTMRTPKNIKAEYQRYHDYQKRLSTINIEELNKDDRINARILENHINLTLGGEKYQFYSTVINPYFGTHYALTQLMTSHHPINSLDDAERYLERLKQFPERIRSDIKELSVQIENGIIPPRFIITKYINILEQSKITNAKENAYYYTFVQRLNESQIRKRNQKDFQKQAYNLVKDSVYFAYELLINQCKQIIDLSDSRAGVWHYPDGDNYYQFCLQNHTGTNYNADDIHEIGLQEIKRIQNKINQKLIEIGYPEDKSFDQNFHQYNTALFSSTDPRFTYFYAPESRQQVLDDFNQMIQIVRLKLPNYFSLLPEALVSVKAIPDYAVSYSGEHYQRGSMDGTIQAAFYTNLSALPRKPGMQTLLYHETIPGHHFQIALAQQAIKYYPFRNLISSTDMVEGWALYAEKLAYENGWFDNIFSELGYLKSELFRAARLVVDTGIHAKHWSREKAYYYLYENAGIASYYEIDRYIIWPGQACAYKIGELRILKLRELMKKELGDQFDIKEFHRLILENGTAPVSIIENIVLDYINTKNQPK